METFIETLKNARNRTIDPRVIDYPFVDNDPKPVVILICIYLAFVHFGKKYMETRPAFNVPIWVLFSYNISLVILSTHIVKELIMGVIQGNYNLLCQNYDSTSQTIGEMRVINALWWYYISKAFEFLDTVWMVLRKKNRQISFLHVFHHSSMLFIEWIVYLSVPGGQAWFGAGLNSLVHIAMYFYYGLSVIPSLRTLLWWKKYLTYFQLAQFILTFSHTIQGVIFSCKFPLWAQYLQSAYCVTMFCLFSNFYRQEYIKKAQAKKRPATVDLNNNETKKVD